MRQRVNEIDKITSRFYTDEFDKTIKPSIQNEQILHSKVSRFININPNSFPYGKVNFGKVHLKKDEDPWINLRPQTTDQKSRFVYQKEVQSIIKNVKPVQSKIRSHSLNNAGSNKIKPPNLEKISINNAKPPLQKDQNSRKQQRIQLIESQVYPQIYYSKINFPENANVMENDDKKIQVIYQIVNKLFNEIPLYIFNVIICKRRDTNNFVIFFDDPEQIPFSKCCNSPIQIDLQESGVGMLVCNNPDCQANILVQFLISFDDAVKLWKHKQIFKQASNRDNQMRSRISSIVSTGKFRHYSLKKEIDKTSQEISQIFTQSEQYNTQQKYGYDYEIDIPKKNKRKYLNKTYENIVNDENTNHDDMFMTNILGQNNENQQPQITIDEDINIDQLAKLDKDIEREFMQNNELNNFKQKISEGLVQNSTIFNKNFYSYFTNQSNNQDLFAKTDGKAKMIRKPRLIQSSQFPKRIQIKPEIQTQSYSFQNNFILKQQNPNQEGYPNYK